MKQLGLIILSGIALVFTGCSTTESAKATPLEPVYGADVDLTSYQTATVQRFDFPDRSLEVPDVGIGLADKIAARLQNDFGSLFDEVRVGEPTGEPGEVVITGRVTKYKPGSRLGRAFGPGITPASLEGELVLKNGATGNPIMIAPIDKLWAWGHSIGAAKGIEDMVEETAASAANMIARAKGWDPELAQRALNP